MSQSAWLKMPWIPGQNPGGCTGAKQAPVPCAEVSGQHPGCHWWINCVWIIFIQRPEQTVIHGAGLFSFLFNLYCTLGLFSGQPLLSQFSFQQIMDGRPKHCADTAPVRIIHSKIHHILTVGVKFIQHGNFALYFSAVLLLAGIPPAE